MDVDRASNDRRLQVLVVDDEENMRHMLSTLLRHEGYAVETAADGEQGLDALQTGSFDFVLCDIRMPQMDGMAFLRASQALAVESTIIMMSAYGTIDQAVEAMKLGAFDFISKPFKRDEILLTIKKAAERDLLARENAQLKNQIKAIAERHRFGQLVAKSDAMRMVFEMAERVAQYDTTVLISGESGTGKELVARAIHYEGKRRGSPWIPINCGGIPENLMESELFGHVKGAFTGADHDRRGLFEEAHHGTIFLDEIGELSLALQVKLLRVLQESEIRPVGATRTRTIDVRVIAATSCNLPLMVAEGTFREDLFYRLNVLSIQMPPLRSRGEDIPMLCRHFIDQFNIALRRQVKGIAPTAMSLLLQHGWPGNVRELENAIERAMVLSDGDVLLPEHFGDLQNRGVQSHSHDRAFGGYSLKDAQKIVEKELIIKALKATGGNRTQASKLLQISHPSLLAKMKAYAIVM